MNFNDVGRNEHVIVGLGNRDVGGFRHPTTSIYIAPCYDSDYDAVYPVHSRNSLIGGGVMLTILSIALTALGVTSFLLRNPLQGIVFTAVGLLVGTAGIACLVVHFTGKRLG